MAKVQIIVEAIDKTKGVFNDVKSFFEDFDVEGLVSGFSMIASSPVIEFLRDSVEYTKEYGEAVDEFSDTTGLSIEETSQLIGAAKGFGIEYDTLWRGIQTAVKKGKDVTIEDLGAIADEYENLPDPTAKTQLLVEYFGTAGIEMSDLFAEGKDGLLTAMEDIDGALLWKEGDKTKFDAYEEAMDDFDLAMSGLKLTIGSELLPSITSIFEQINLVIGKLDEFDAKWRLFQFNATTAGGLILWNAERKENFVAPELDYAEGLSSYQAYRDYADEILNITNLTVDGYGALRTRTGEAIDGVKILTEEEWNAKYAADEIGGAIGAIPNNVTKTIDIVANWRGEAGGIGAAELLAGVDLNGNGIIGLAHGGVVAGNTPYIVGERGPELFMPQTSGKIIPNHELSGGGGGDFDYTRLGDEIVQALMRSGYVR